MSDGDKTINPKVVYHQIDENSEGQRIDNYLLRELKGVPKSRIYRLLRKGEVRVNKSRKKPDYKLAIDDVVRIPPVRMDAAAPKASPSQKLSDILEAAILYEDKSLLIINKPSGLAVHGGSGINLGLIEALRSIREDARYLELVHRLDRDTSGCVMIAKKRSMLKHLHAQLREGGIDKRYLALVEGRWPSRRQLVNVPLLKNELKSGERVVTVSPEGKKSRTEFSVIERFKDATLVQAKPITGRTHQIRVHAKHAGHFILGDEKYGDPAINKQFKTFGLKRLFLHAASLSLNLPDHDSILKIEAPLDNDLQRLLKTLPAAGDS